jgi:hypothetical protein
VADDFGLISGAERQHVLDQLQRQADAGTLSPAELSDRIARVHAAQTHAGLEAILRELPAEQPWRMPKAPPPPAGPGLPWWQRPGVVVGAAMVVGVCIFVAAVVTAGSDDGDDDSATGRTIIELPPAEAPDPTTTTRPPTTTTTSTTTTTPPFAVDPIVDGSEVVLRVGQDIQPGRYMSGGPLCYWERLHRLDPGLRSVIANGLGPKVIVDVRAGDAGLRSRSCREWVPYAPLPTPVSSFGDGDWLVGSDIPPGTYSAPGADLCMWESRTDFTHDAIDGIIDDNIIDASTTVTLRAGNGFSTLGCGTWTKVG